MRSFEHEQRKCTSREASSRNPMPEKAASISSEPESAWWNICSAASRISSRRARTACRVLGASTQLVRRIQAAEALALGALAAGVGGALSLLASWALVHWLFELPFQPPWLDLALLVCGTLAITAFFGALGSRHAREQSPQAALRSSERLGTGAA